MFGISPEDIAIGGRFDMVATHPETLTAPGTVSVRQASGGNSFFDARAVQRRSLTPRQLTISEAAKVNLSEDKVSIGLRQSSVTPLSSTNTSCAGSMCRASRFQNRRRALTRSLSCSPAWSDFF